MLPCGLPSTVAQAAVGTGFRAGLIEYERRMFNLLDTPGHEDFSEDTYRVLTAVDSAVMVLDSAKGVEGQTKKLFEVIQ